MNETKSPFTSLTPLLLGFTIFGWSVLFVWQGLDFTDMGFLLYTYQKFYSAPESSTYFLLNWLTAFFGHWLGDPFGGKVVYYKLAASGIFAVTGVIAYMGVQSILRSGWPLAIAVFVTFLFSTKSSTNWVDYNNLTALFYTLGAVSLFAGLVHERQLWVILGGAVLGANMFIRFPNVLGISLVLAIMLNGWLERWPIKRTFAWSVYYLLGWFIGIVLIAMMIFFHGHADLYLTSIERVYERLHDSGSEYYSTNLMNLFIRNHLYAGVLGSLVVSAGLAILRISVTKSATIKAMAVILSAVVLVIAFGLIESWRWAVPGLLYIGLIWIVLKEVRTNKEITLLAFLAFMTLVLTPLGSGSGIRNAIYGQWLALPLVLTWLWKETRRKAALPFLPYYEADQLAAWILILALAGFSLITSWYYTYRDSIDRLSLSHPISHPLLSGTYTTRERARVVEELLDELPRWVRPGDPLLAYPDIPMVHYLSQTTAWLENPWPNLYREKKLLEKLAEKQTDKEPLPIIVRSLGATRNRTWPNEIRRKPKESWYIFDQFVSDNGYQSVWQNEFFEILKSD